MQYHDSSLAQVACWWSQGNTSKGEDDQSGFLVSAGGEGHVLFWAMDKSRIPRAGWKEGGACANCHKTLTMNFRDVSSFRRGFALSLTRRVCVLGCACQPHFAVIMMVVLFL